MTSRATVTSVAYNLEDYSTTSTHELLPRKLRNHLSSFGTMHRFKSCNSLRPITLRPTVPLLQHQCRLEAHNIILPPTLSSYKQHTNEYHDRISSIWNVLIANTAKIRMSRKKKSIRDGSYHLEDEGMSVK